MSRLDPSANNGRRRHGFARRDLAQGRFRPTCVSPRPALSDGSAPILAAEHPTCRPVSVGRIESVNYKRFGGCCLRFRSQNRRSVILAAKFGGAYPSPSSGGGLGQAGDFSAFDTAWRLTLSFCAISDRSSPFHRSISICFLRSDSFDSAIRRAWLRSSPFSAGCKVWPSKYWWK